MKPQQLASLVSWSPPWTSRILGERNDKTGLVAAQGKVTASPAQHPPDNKSGSKKVVTWDELVSSEPFLWSEFRNVFSGSRQEVSAIRGGIC